MVSNNKKKRKNNRNNKKNKLKKEKLLDHTSQATNEEEQELVGDEELKDSIDQSTFLKRNHPDEDSDVDESEGKPKKKKKKQIMPTDSGDNKKGKKSIRQMKKEKHAQRQADAQAAAKDQLKSQCLSYLSQWKHDKSNWKFMKAKQVWLYKNKFSSYLLPDSSWPLLLEYFESAMGNIRKMLLEDANKIIKQMDEWTESQKGEDKDEDDEQENNKPDDTSYKRARDLIQCLQE